MRIVIAFLSCLATPLVAQSDQQMTQAMCKALFPDDPIWIGADPVRVDDDGWCRLEGISEVFNVGAVRVRMPDAIAFAETGLPPRRMSLRLDDVTPAFSAEEPDAQVFLNLFGTLDQTFDVAVDYRWDAEALALTLEDASLREKGGNQFHLSGVLENLDISSLDAITASVSQTALTDMTYRSETDGTFNSAAIITTGALALFGQISRQSDEVVAKAGLLSAISEIPDTVLAPEDAAALTGFVSAWPYPNGAFEVTVTSTRGLTFARMIAVIPDGYDDTADLFGFFPDVTITASWTPAE